MEITGKVVAVLDVQSGVSKNGNEWKKQEFVLETDGQYPKKACLTLFGDKVGLCPQVEETVTVTFDINAHEYNGRWFNSVDAWKVERAATPQPQPAVQNQPATMTATPQPQQQQPSEPDDNLPF